MTYSELEKKLRQAGCYPTRKGKRHTKWYSPKTERTFPVSRHKTQQVPNGTLKSILEDAGL